MRKQHKEATVSTTHLIRFCNPCLLEFLLSTALDMVSLPLIYFCCCCFFFLFFFLSWSTTTFSFSSLLASNCFRPVAAGLTYRSAVKASTEARSRSGKKGVHAHTCTYAAAAIGSVVFLSLSHTDTHWFSSAVLLGMSE